MNHPISCILFDLDNTLTDRAASIRQFSRQFFADFHHNLPEHITFENVHSVMQIGDGGGYRPKEGMFQEIQSNLPWIQPPTLEVIAEYWYRLSPQLMCLRSGVSDVLEELLRRGFKLGIITNGKTDVQNATIDATHLRDYFSVIIVSEASGFRKPDPRIFHLALSTLDAAPENAVYVGDHPQSDVGGARNAGLQAVWFAGVHPWPENLQKPSYQITQINQLLDLL